MYVLTGTAARAAELRTACDPVGIEVRMAAPAAGAQPASDLLAVFYDPDGAGPIPLPAVLDHGAYALLVVPEPARAQAVLAATRAGYSFVLTEPLRTGRARALLDYLARVAPPRQAKQLTLGPDGTLHLAARSVAVGRAEAAVLREFARHPDRIVPRERLVEASAGAPLRDVLTELRAHLEALGSGAQVLNVPHVGYRLAGSVTLD